MTYNHHNDYAIEPSGSIQFIKLNVQVIEEDIGHRNYVKILFQTDPWHNDFETQGHKLFGHVVIRF